MSERDDLLRIIERATGDDLPYATDQAIADDVLTYFADRLAAGDAAVAEADTARLAVKAAHTANERLRAERDAAVAALARVEALRAYLAEKAASPHLDHGGARILRGCANDIRRAIDGMGDGNADA